MTDQQPDPIESDADVVERSEHLDRRFMVVPVDDYVRRSVVYTGLVIIFIALLVGGVLGYNSLRGETNKLQALVAADHAQTLANHETGIQSRVVACEQLINEGVTVQILPSSCKTAEIRKLYDPETYKPALGNYALFLLEFDCNFYSDLKMLGLGIASPPVCSLIPLLPTGR